jgi:hypothetical protein
MAISQQGGSTAQNPFDRILEYIEPAEEVPNTFARYLESENQANLGDCYWIITTSIKRYFELFILTSTSGNISSKCAALTER